MNTDYVIMICWNCSEETKGKAKLEEHDLGQEMSCKSTDPWEPQRTLGRHLEREFVRVTGELASVALLSSCEDTEKSAVYSLEEGFHRNPTLLASSSQTQPFELREINL